ncbi:hypothetical protein AVEN_194586-1 [Araneus ventricosus]|uniref:Uncharacterized protein n=1 Tax=Araneus ventricosus TaxID=182803 RepID=A0A4Y2A6N2_ARAVE|nr:hypothetical protein AVEN_194586-1 [Araneus ventricosus]
MNIELQIKRSRLLLVKVILERVDGPSSRSLQVYCLPEDFQGKSVASSVGQSDLGAPRRGKTTHFTVRVPLALVVDSVPILDAKQRFSGTPQQRDQSTS